ncbi:hypothetical protein EI94DRAFT_1700864 [Lactarius quietus]|nr:hypothetical protein EI94DRAFT_1700864 [Lactarius quietus]
MDSGSGLGFSPLFLTFPVSVENAKPSLIYNCPSSSQDAWKKPKVDGSSPGNTTELHAFKSFCAEGPPSRNEPKRPYVLLMLSDKVTVRSRGPPTDRGRGPRGPALGTVTAVVDINACSLFIFLSCIEKFLPEVSISARWPYLSAEAWVEMRQTAGIELTKGIGKWHMAMAQRKKADSRMCAARAGRKLQIETATDNRQWQTAIADGKWQTQKAMANGQWKNSQKVFGLDYRLPIAGCMRTVAVVNVEWQGVTKRLVWVASLSYFGAPGTWAECDSWVF